MASISKIEKKNSNGDFEEYVFGDSDSSWKTYVTIPTDEVIENGYPIKWSEDYQYEPLPENIHKQNVYVFWDGILLKKATSDEDGHYSEGCQYATAVQGTINADGSDGRTSESDDNRTSYINVEGMNSVYIEWPTIVDWSTAKFYRTYMYDSNYTYKSIEYDWYEAEASDESKTRILLKWNNSYSYMRIVFNAINEETGYSSVIEQDFTVAIIDGDTSNTIYMYRTDDDGTYTLTDSIPVTIIGRKV